MRYDDLSRRQVAISFFRAALPLLWLAAGCGGAPTATGPCAAMAASCFANQQICVEMGATARCQPCPSGQYAAASSRCLAIEGTAARHDFAMFTSQPGEEIAGLCQSVTLHNPTELWIQSVELDQNVASHHSNWTFVPANEFPGPDGVWRCRERGYDQLSAALRGGVLYAQSTQTPHEVQRFPNGAAIRIPPYARVIGDVHLLNASRAAITGRVTLTLYQVPAAQVKVKLVPFHLTFEALDIPPRAVSRFIGQCDLINQFIAAGADGLDMKLYYALPHTHSLGRRFFLSLVGGARDGENLLEASGSYDSEPHGRAFDPPLATRGAEGFRFGCQFDNPRDVRVKYGIGDQEMCEMLGFAEMPLAFEGTIMKSQSDGSDGAVQKFTGPCGVIAFPWDHNRKGGPPP